MTEEEIQRVKSLERKFYHIPFGENGNYKEVIGKRLKKTYLLGLYPLCIRASEVKQASTARKPISIRNKDAIDQVRPILMGCILSKRFNVTFNKEFACRRLSLKRWPTRHVNSMLSKCSSSIDDDAMDKLCEDFRVYCVKNFLTISLKSKNNNEK